MEFIKLAVLMIVSVTALILMVSFAVGIAHSVASQRPGGRMGMAESLLYVYVLPCIGTGAIAFRLYQFLGM